MIGEVGRHSLGRGVPRRRLLAALQLVNVGEAPIAPQRQSARGEGGAGHRSPGEPLFLMGDGRPARRIRAPDSRFTGSGDQPTETSDCGPRIAGRGGRAADGTHLVIRGAPIMPPPRRPGINPITVNVPLRPVPRIYSRRCPRRCALGYRVVMQHTAEPSPLFRLKNSIRRGDSRLRPTSCPAIARVASGCRCR
jgi:hypothetical protein